MATIDVHQHLWPEPLLAALARRRQPPRLVRHGDGWTLRMPGECDWPVALADHDPELRLRALDGDGVDRALVAHSVPVSTEALTLK